MKQPYNKLGGQTDMEWEDTEERCPKCKAGLLQRTYAANGPDDYTTVYQCPNCEERFES